MIRLQQHANLVEASVSVHKWADLLLRGELILEDEIRELGAPEEVCQELNEKAASLYTQYGIVGVFATEEDDDEEEG